MTALTDPLPTKPASGQLADAAEIKSKFDTIYTWGTGQIDDSAITAAAEILGTKLASAFLDKVGVNGTSTTRRGKAIIAGAESRANTAYGTLTTPDRVSGIVLPTDGLIVVAFFATWQSSVASAGRAAIFLGSNQLKAAGDAAAPAVQEAQTAANAGENSTLFTYPQGLASYDANNAYSGDVTTGQVVGNSFVSGGGGVCHIFAAAGTYDVSVQFKATSGAVLAQGRKLWVAAYGF